jgi:hypothetical protein
LKNISSHIPILFFLLIFIGFLSVSSKSVAGQELGAYPLCEASAAIILPCPDSNDQCLLVADNEQRNQLFFFTIKNGGINPKFQKELILDYSDESGISDIEAIIHISKNEILMLGSHSRNKRCELKNNRRQFALVRISNTKGSVSKLVKSEKISCGNLFRGIPQNNQTIKAVCKAIDDAEELASVDCENSSPFNAEGAIAITRNNRTDIWIGLRAPILSEHPSIKNQRDFAILLHMKNISTYEFDRAALLDLNGRGIRELALNNGVVWVISGPVNDKLTVSKKESFQLLRFPESALTANSIIKPTFVRNLPLYSEGLAITGKSVFIVTDGDIGRGSNQECKIPSKLHVFSLP